jgi:hypothetical protein
MPTPTVPPKITAIPNPTPKIRSNPGFRPAEADAADNKELMESLGGHYDGRLLRLQLLPRSRIGSGLSHGETSPLVTRMTIEVCLGLE